MADFGSPVAGGVNVDPNKGLSTLSGLMGLQQQQQSITSGALGIQGQQAKLPAIQAESQLQQQKVQQAQTMSAMLQRGIDDQGNSLRGADGELDPAKIAMASGRVAPLVPEIAQQVIKTHSDKIALQSASQSLDSAGRARLAGPLQALGLNPSDENISTARSTINGLVEAHPELAPAAGHALDLVDHIAQVKDPGQRTKLATQLSAFIQPGQTVATQPTGATMDTGPNVQAGTVAPPAAGGGFTPTTETGKAVPPSASIFTDARTGNMYAVNPQNPGTTILVGQGGKLFGGSTGTTAVAPNGAPTAHAPPARAAATGSAPATAPTTAAPSTLPTGAANPNSPPVYTPGEAGIVEQNTANINANRKGASDALLQRDILGRIQTIAATPGLYLGPGSQTVADLATRAAQIPGFEGAARYANNYNELVKFMAQNAARQGAALGLQGSDSRLEMAAHANPNADPMDSRTVQNVSQYMGGIVRMQQAKADAMDTWLSQPGNSAKNEHQFEANWRNNADPRLFQIAEMKDQGAALDYARLHIRKSEQSALAEKHDWLVKVGALPASEASAAGQGSPAAAAPASATGTW